jgi:hypothetical protein
MARQNFFAKDPIEGSARRKSAQYKAMNLT